MRKFFHQIHLWLSIPLGILISIICFTGAILVFEKEITQLIYPETQVRQAETQPAQQHRHDSQAETQPAQQHRHDSQASPQQNRNQRPEFFRQVRALHRWLLDAPAKKGETSVGKMVVGITTVVMILILVSGLVIWFPRHQSSLKKGLQVSCTKGWPRFWHDSHVALGFYSTLFLLIMALTGLTWSFSGYRTFMYDLFSNLPIDNLRGFFYSLHTGTWGGLTTRILYFLAALIGGILPLSGYYLWWKKRKRK